MGLVKCDYRELLELQKRLDDAQIDNIIRRLTIELAEQLLSMIKNNTPVGQYGTKTVEFIAHLKERQVSFIAKGKHVSFKAKARDKHVKFVAHSSLVGGTLRRNWYLGGVTKSGNSYHVEIYNNIFYAL